MTDTQTLKRYYVTSTWGGHYVLSSDDLSAEDTIQEEGYKILESEEYDKDMHGEWEGE